MKAIHNAPINNLILSPVVLYPKDTEKWKQFTTYFELGIHTAMLFCIPKILKNESNSQHTFNRWRKSNCCFVSQRYWKMKAIHNRITDEVKLKKVVLYPKDTEKWKQFTTLILFAYNFRQLFCIPKILKNESNSQPLSCNSVHFAVVLYPKDTEKWKQFTTISSASSISISLFCIPKILKNESNSQHNKIIIFINKSCFVSQRYWKMKAIHNY